MKNKIPVYLIFLTVIGILIIWNTYSILVKSKSPLICIPPNEPFAYEVALGLPRYPENPILPSIPWLLETETSFSNPELLYVMTSQDGESIIWVKTGLNDDKKYYMYKTKSKIWLEVPVDDKTFQENINISEMFIDKNGTVWAYTVSTINDHQTPIFVKYNAENHNLYFDKNSSDIPIGAQSETNVILDINDVFWIFKSDDSIYYYDIQRQKVEKRISLENYDISDVVLGLDGNFYFLDQQKTIQISPGSDNMYRRGAFYKYSPQENEIVLLQYLLEPTPFPLNLLIDKLGNVWFDGLGWINPDGKWFQINKSPLFISTNIDGSGGQIYRWQTPRVILESSNRYLWFRSSNGMTWLNPDKGEWCWFTTYQSNIVEDSDRNLWMIADNKLYKLPLGEQ